MTNHPKAATSTSERAAPRARRPVRGRRMLALAALAALAALLAACGSSSASTTTTTSGSTTSGSGSGAGSNGSGSGRQFPGASGTIATVNGTSMEVQNPSSGQTTVNYTPSTTFRQIVSSNASAVTVGSCISAFGKPTSGSSSSTGAFGEPITATTVSVTQPTSGSCNLGGGGFGGGRFPAGGRRPTGGSSTNSTGTRPPGAGRFGNGQFGAASGSVTVVNGSAVTVNETNPRTKKTSSVVVTLTSTTTFTTTQNSSASALVVGQCARAMGSANMTGAIAAQAITVSAPGPNGCTTGFGFRGGAGGGPGGTGGVVTTGA